MAGNVVRILITAKDEVSSSLDRIKDKATLLSKTDIGKGLLQGAGIAGFNMLKGAAMGALDSVVDFAKGSVAAAMDEQKGIAVLDASLKANVANWESNTQAIEKQIRASERLGFSDDAVRASLAKLVGATHDVGKAFEIMGVAQNLARLRGISLEQASDALIRVEGGQYRALKQLGIVLRDGATATEALAAVQKVAAGQDEAYTQTLAGKAEILQIKYDNLQETVGGALIPYLDSLATASIGASDALDTSGKTTQEQTDGLVALGEALAAVLPAAAGLKGKFTEAGAAINGSVDATNAAALAWDTGSEKTMAARAALVKVTDAAKHTNSVMYRLGGHVAIAADGFKDLKTWSEKASEILYGSKKAPEELALAWRTGKSDLKNAQDAFAGIDDKIQELKRKGEPVPGKLAQKWRDAKQDVIDHKKEVVNLGLEMTTTGQIKYTSLLIQLDKLGIKLRNDTVDARLLNDQLRIWGAMSGKNGAGTNDGGSRDFGRHGAAGTMIPPYGAAVVGEHGRELIRMGAAGGQVVPSISGAGGGGGSININISTPVMTPGSAQALADAIGPALTRWQQARGL